jgi:hypothetical protein
MMRVLPHLGRTKQAGFQLFSPQFCQRTLQCNQLEIDEQTGKQMTVAMSRNHSKYEEAFRRADGEKSTMDFSSSGSRLSSFIMVPQYLRE